MRLASLAWGGALTTSLGMVACSTFDAASGAAPPADAAIESSADVGVDPTPADAAIDRGDLCNPTSSYDLQGCLCATPGVAAPCYHGVPGAKSACNVAGVQRCEVGEDQKARWSICSGGSKPAPSEICHDGVDDDCDGKIDQGCTCSDDIDLCRSNASDAGATFNPDAYTIFTIPSAPKANEPFDLFIVTKNKSLSAPGLVKNNAICYGGGLLTPCQSPGAGCSGWKVGLFHGVKEAAGSYTFSIKDPQGPTGCEGVEIASKIIVVSS